MTNKITIYTLQGCSVCDRLKNELNHSFIKYKEVSYATDQLACEKLENATKSNIYPMCIIESFPNRKILICFAKESNQLNQIKNLNSTTILTYVHSIDNMLTIIKNA
jgi:arsenate reductase-like glutaredoxin family protein